MKGKLYWHFAALKDGKPVMRDGTIIEIGKVYSSSRTELCKVGFHGSLEPLDALQYAPGCFVSRRRIMGDLKIGDDKVCGTHCVHEDGFNAESVLKEFSRWCALQVAHLWSIPDIVLEYLQTGNEDIRSVASDLARDALIDERRKWEIGYSTWDGVMGEKWRLKWGNAQIWNSERYAAWSATDLSAEFAARMAAKSSIRVLARYEISNRVINTTRDAAKIRFNEKLSSMLIKAMKEK